MGDHPAFIIEHKGVVAAVVGWKNDIVLFGRDNVLGELHEMPMVEGKNHHPQQVAVFLSERRRQPDHALVGPSLDGGFRGRLALKLVLFIHMPTRQSRHVDLSDGQVSRFAEIGLREVGRVFRTRDIPQDG